MTVPRFNRAKTGSLCRTAAGIAFALCALCTAFGILLTMPENYGRLIERYAPFLSPAVCVLPFKIYIFVAACAFVCLSIGLFLIPEMPLGGHLLFRVGTRMLTLPGGLLCALLLVCYAVSSFTDAAFLRRFDRLSPVLMLFLLLLAIFILQFVYGASFSRSAGALGYVLYAGLPGVVRAALFAVCSVAVGGIVFAAGIAAGRPIFRVAGFCGFFGEICVAVWRTAAFFPPRKTS